MHDLCLVSDCGTDAADNWIADRIGAGDIAVASDIPLAARCIASAAKVLRPNGDPLDETSIGGVLAARNLMTDLRSAGAVTGGPPPCRFCGIFLYGSLPAMRRQS